MFQVQILWEWSSFLGKSDIEILDISTINCNTIERQTSCKQFSKKADRSLTGLNFEIL